jgi:hypothetical protein
MLSDSHNVITRSLTVLSQLHSYWVGAFSNCTPINEIGGILASSGMFDQFIESAPNGSNGQYKSYFGGKMYDPNDVKRYILDTMNNDKLSNKAKTERINKINKYKEVELDAIDIGGVIK